jgi:hypothetical protein
MRLAFSDWNLNENLVENRRFIGDVGAFFFLRPLVFNHRAGGVFEVPSTSAVDDADTLEYRVAAHHDSRYDFGFFSSDLV